MDPETCTEPLSLAVEQFLTVLYFEQRGKLAEPPDESMRGQSGAARRAPLLNSFTFGGILPLVLLLFVRILGDTTEAEAAPYPELTKAKQTIEDLRAELDDAELRISDAESGAIAAEQGFVVAGYPFARLSHLSITAKQKP